MSVLIERTHKETDMQIEFVSANGGGIEFYRASNGFGWVKQGFGRSIEECAAILADYPLANSASASSSMDYASEFGFENDWDAREMLREALMLNLREAA